jgi:hypothetical protein
MGNMPAIPESTRSSITLRLLRHAKEHWRRLENLQVTSRGGFAYTTAALPAAIRSRCSGSATAAQPTQEALDTACTLYYAGTSDKPSPEPRRTYGG